MSKWADVMAMVTYGNGYFGCVWCVVAATPVGGAHLVVLLPNVNRVDDGNGPSVYSRGVVKLNRVSH